MTPINVEINVTGGMYGNVIGSVSFDSRKYYYEARSVRSIGSDGAVILSDPKFYIDIADQDGKKVPFDENIMRTFAKTIFMGFLELAEKGKGPFEGSRANLLGNAQYSILRTPELETLIKYEQKC